MFTRARKAKGQLYYQLVHGHRDEVGRVQQVTLGLGTCATVADALDAERRRLARAKSQRAKWAKVQNSDVAARLFKRFYRVASEAEERVAKLEEAQRMGVG